MAKPTDQHMQDSDSEALLNAAVDLIAQGDWAGAATSLENAAALHAERGRSYDEARCLQLAATLRRGAGDLLAAKRLSARAASIPSGDSRLGVSIAAEQGEAALACGDFDGAVVAWTSALERGSGALLTPDDRAALLLRRAPTFLALGRIPPALADYDQAYRLLQESHTDQTACFVRTEEASSLLDAGYCDESKQIIDELECHVPVEERTSHLAAEIFLARARQERAAGRFPSASDFARRARDAALEAVAPVTYFSAGAELAAALDAAGERVAAYGALASAWVTLADLLGGEAARSWVEPCLVAYQLKWGTDDFAETKSRYETIRRAEMSGR